MNDALGRTNQAFPRLWLRPVLGPHLPGTDEFSAFASACADHGAPIDATGNSALWGEAFRGKEVDFFAFGGLEIETAQDEKHAADMVQAHLLQVLSALGRETLLAYGLRIRRALEEYQIRGALSALEHSRDEGLLRFFGLKADGPSTAVLSVWQFHDAFELLFCPRNAESAETWETLSRMAAQRRVGVVATDTDSTDGTVLRAVSTVAELEDLRSRYV